MNFFTQEKIGDQKNAAYSQDFKTLADVLIQETVRHDLGRHYPELKDNIHVIIAYWNYMNIWQEKKYIHMSLQLMLNCTVPI